VNVFVDLIGSGRIRDESDLKRSFWALAKRLHPDVSAGAGAERAFIKLKADFDEALSALPIAEPASPPAAPPSRESLVGLFLDLAQSGFPVDRRVRDASPAYLKRIEGFSAAVRAYGIPGVEDFAAVEDEFYAIRGDDIVDNPLFGMVRMILYNICSYHYWPTARTRRSVEAWLGDARGRLEARGCPGALAFLSWLVEDLGRGAVAARR